MNFSADGSEVINRAVSSESNTTSSFEDIYFKYEITRTIKTIHSHNYRRIALQFPDSLLADAPRVASTIETETGASVFVLADTSYGACCVDEVAAEHVNADLIVHYGRACLSPTNRISVVYVFGKVPVDIQHCVSEFEKIHDNNKATKCLLMYDVTCHHVMDELLGALKTKGYPNVIKTEIQNEFINDTSVNSACPSSSCCSVTKEEPRSTLETQQQSTNRTFTLPTSHSLSDYSIFYVGPSSLTLSNICINYSTLDVHSYNPTTRETQQETSKTSKLLMRRYYLVQQARDADVVAIVVGTLGVSHYLSLINRLMKLLRMNHKKPYLLSMGKINPAKLANFMEIDVFVLIACPENSLIDSKIEGFMKPIVTPWEMLLALSNSEWTGDYVTGLGAVNQTVDDELHNQSMENDGQEHRIDTPNNEEEEEDEEPHFSLVTGELKSSKYRHISLLPTPSNSPTPTKSQSLTLRNQNNQLISTAASASSEYLLNSRTWKGLEMNLGETPVELATEGRGGIARGYEGESGKDIQRGEIGDGTTTEKHSS